MTDILLIIIIVWIIWLWVLLYKRTGIENDYASLLQKEVWDLKMFLTEMLNKKFIDLMKENKETEKTLRESVQDFLKDVNERIKESLENTKQGLNQKFEDLNTMVKEKLEGISDRVDKRLENEFISLLNKYNLSEELLSAFDFILNRERNNSYEQEDIQKWKKQWEKIKLENKMKATEDAMLRTQNPALYNKLEQDWVNLNTEKLLIEEELHGSVFTEKEFLSLSKKTRWIIQEPLTFWKKANPQIRQLLIGVRFGWELKYTKKSGYRTPDSWVFNCLSMILPTDNTCFYPEWDLNPHVLTDTRFWV